MSTGDRPPIGALPRRAMTLVELLVTVTILMMLLVVALPAITPSAELRQIREATRQLNVFFAAARAQAMQTGRPVGVALERQQGNIDPQTGRAGAGLAQAAVSVYQVEVPPPYAGDTLTATARVTPVSNNGTWAQFNVSLSAFTSNKVSNGDLVRFNNQGPFYTVVQTGNPLRAQLDVRDRKIYPTQLGTNQVGVPYQFYRQPVRSPVAPLELPASVVIDLQASGTDTYPNYFAPHSQDLSSSTPTPVIFMFAPTGALHDTHFRSSVNTSGATRTIREPVYLLVGRRDRIVVSQDVTAATAERQRPNWFNPASLWLTIAPQTGIVSAKENYRVPVNNGRFSQGISLARTLARQAQSLGGR